MTDQTREMPESIYPVTPRQKALYDAYEDVVDLFGKFNQGTGPDGAHYCGLPRSRTAGTDAKRGARAWIQ